MKNKAIAVVLVFFIIISIIPVSFSAECMTAKGKAELFLETLDGFVDSKTKLNRDELEYTASKIDEYIKFIEFQASLGIQRKDYIRKAIASFSLITWNTDEYDDSILENKNNFKRQLKRILGEDKIPKEAPILPLPLIISTDEVIDNFLIDEIDLENIKNLADDIIDTILETSSRIKGFEELLLEKELTDSDQERELKNLLKEEFFIGKYFYDLHVKVTDELNQKLAPGQKPLTIESEEVEEELEKRGLLPKESETKKFTDLLWVQFKAFPMKLKDVLRVIYTKDFFEDKSYAELFDEMFDFELEKREKLRELKNKNINFVYRPLVDFFNGDYLDITEIKGKPLIRTFDFEGESWGAVLLQLAVKDILKNIQQKVADEIDKLGLDVEKEDEVLKLFVETLNKDIFERGEKVPIKIKLPASFVFGQEIITAGDTYGYAKEGNDIKVITGASPILGIIEKLTTNQPSKLSDDIKFTATDGIKEFEYFDDKGKRRENAGVFNLIKNLLDKDITINDLKTLKEFPGVSWHEIKREPTFWTFAPDTPAEDRYIKTDQFLVKDDLTLVDLDSVREFLKAEEPIFDEKTADLVYHAIPSFQPVISQVISPAPKWISNKITDLMVEEVAEEEIPAVEILTPFDQWEYLGEGDFGIVYKVTARIQGVPKEIALKVFSKGSEEEREAVHKGELAAYQRLTTLDATNNYIPAFYGSYVDQAGNPALIVEFIEGQEYGTLKTLDEKIKFLKRLAESLKQFHTEAVHGDVYFKEKPNALYDAIKDQIRFLDLQLSKIKTDPQFLLSFVSDLRSELLPELATSSSVADETQKKEIALIVETILVDIKDVFRSALEEGRVTSEEATKLLEGLTKRRTAPLMQIATRVDIKVLIDELNEIIKNPEILIPEIAELPQVKVLTSEEIKKYDLESKVEDTKSFMKMDLDKAITAQTFSDEDLKQFGLSREALEFEANTLEEMIKETESKEQKFIDVDEEKPELLIGKGIAGGDVYKGLYENLPSAVKVFIDENYPSLITEWKAYKKLPDEIKPYFPEFFSFGFSYMERLGQARPSLMMEFIEGKKYKELALEEKIEFMQKLSNRVRDMHKYGFAHGDLHFDNVLCSKQEPKIMDLGFAKVKGVDDFESNAILDYIRKYSSEEEELVEGFIQNLLALTKEIETEPEEVKKEHKEIIADILKNILNDIKENIELIPETKINLEILIDYAEKITPAIKDTKDKAYLKDMIEWLKNPAILPVPEEIKPLEQRMKEYVEDKNLVFKKLEDVSLGWTKEPGEELVIGEGTFGKVYKGTYEGVNFVVKVFEKFEDMEEAIASLADEWKINSEIQDKIINSERFFPKVRGITISKGYPALVIDYAEGEQYATLKDVDEKIEFFEELVKLLNEIHKDVAHSDLHVENILFNPAAEKDRVKAIDLERVKFKEMPIFAWAVIHDYLRSNGIVDNLNNLARERLNVEQKQKVAGIINSIFRGVIDTFKTKEKITENEQKKIKELLARLDVIIKRFMREKVEGIQDVDNLLKVLEKLSEGILIEEVKPLEIITWSEAKIINNKPVRFFASGLEDKIIDWYVTLEEIPNEFKTTEKITSFWDELDKWKKHFKLEAEKVEGIDIEKLSKEKFSDYLKQSYYRNFMPNILSELDRLESFILALAEDSAVKEIINHPLYGWGLVYDTLENAEKDIPLNLVLDYSPQEISNKIVIDKDLEGILNKIKEEISLDDITKTTNVLEKSLSDFFKPKTSEQFRKSKLGVYRILSERGIPNYLINDIWSDLKDDLIEEVDLIDKLPDLQEVGFEERPLFALEQTIDNYKPFDKGAFAKVYSTNIEIEGKPQKVMIKVPLNHWQIDMAKEEARKTEFAGDIAPKVLGYYVENKEIAGVIYEFIEGVDLYEAIKNPKIMDEFVLPEERVKIYEQIVDGILDLWEKGIAHRDIAVGGTEELPHLGNVMIEITPEGKFKRVRVIDFGLSDIRKEHLDGFGRIQERDAVGLLNLIRFMGRLGMDQNVINSLHKKIREADKEQKIIIKERLTEEEILARAMTKEVVADMLSEIGKIVGNWIKTKDDKYIEDYSLISKDLWSNFYKKARGIFEISYCEGEMFNKQEEIFRDWLSLKVIELIQIKKLSLEDATKRINADKSVQFIINELNVLRRTKGLSEYERAIGVNGLIKTIDPIKGTNLISICAVCVDFDISQKTIAELTNKISMNLKNMVRSLRNYDRYTLLNKGNQTIIQNAVALTVDWDVYTAEKKIKLKGYLSELSREAVHVLKEFLLNKGFILFEIYKEGKISIEVKTIEELNKEFREEIIDEVYKNGKFFVQFLNKEGYFTLIIDSKGDIILSSFVKEIPEIVEEVVIVPPIKVGPCTGVLPTENPCCNGQGNLINSVCCDENANIKEGVLFACGPDSCYSYWPDYPFNSGTAAYCLKNYCECSKTVLTSNDFIQETSINIAKQRGWIKTGPEFCENSVDLISPSNGASWSSAAKSCKTILISESCTSGERKPCPENINPYDNIGECKNGEIVCNDNRWSFECINSIGPALEINDNKDNDCDGVIDNGFSCRLGETKSCYPANKNTLNLGICSAGVQTCSDLGVWGVCKDAVIPQQEICDGLDNDCDGYVDDIDRYCYSGPEGTAGKGACRAGIQQCIDGVWSDCIDEIVPADGVSCDIDIEVPEAEQIICYDGPENTDNIGICRRGLRTFENNDWSDCRNQVLPTKELCDNLDNDCNGIIDDNCLIPTFGDISMIGLNNYAQCNVFDSCAIPTTGFVRSEETSITPAVVPKGYDLIGTPFKMFGEGEFLDLSSSIPADVTDIHVVRCRDNKCKVLTQAEITKGLTFAGQDISAAAKGADIRTIDYIAPEETEDIEEKVFLTAPGRIASAGFAFAMPKIEEPATTVLKNIDSAVKYPFNSNLKLSKGPIVFKLEKPLPNPPFPVNIEIPYTLLDDVDENTISIYAAIADGWEKIESDIDKTNNVIKADINDIFPYLDIRNQATFAAYGLKCEACKSIVFERAYEGSSRDAVIFVPGLGGRAEAFSPVIKEMELTKQPWQLWKFGYPLDYDVDKAAQYLANEIKAHEAEFSEINLVGHSLGGLIVQKALRNLEDNNEIKIINNVDKVIIIGTPNAGSPAIEVYKNLLSFAIKSQADTPLFELSPDILDDLINGRNIERVDGPDYYVIAGDKSYDFNLGYFKVGVKPVFESEPNDGIVTVKSAQVVGGYFIDDSCSDFFELPLTHTELNDRPLARNVITHILTEDKITEKNQFSRFKIDQSKEGDIFFLIGKTVSNRNRARVANCGCGDHICSIDENKVTCPEDCAKAISLFGVCLGITIALYAFSTILLLSTLLFLVKFFRKKKIKKLKSLGFVFTSLIILAALFSAEYFICNKLLLLPLIALGIVILLLIISLFARKPD